MHVGVVVNETHMSFIKAYVDRNIHMDIFINKLCANNKYLCRKFRNLSFNSF